MVVARQPATERRRASVPTGAKRLSLSRARVWVSSLKPPRVFCVLFLREWMHYLNSVSAAGTARTPLSLLFLELSGYCVNAVQLHVNAADVMVRRGTEGDDFTEEHPDLRGSQVKLR